MPRFGLEVKCTEPPSAFRRSRIPASPSPSEWWIRSAAKPTPLSRTVHETRPDLELDARAARPGVLEHVVQRLLDDPIQSDLHHGGQAAGFFPFYRDRDTGAPGHVFGEELQRGQQAQPIEDDWPQFVREVPQLRLDPVQQRLDLLQPGTALRRQLVRYVGDSEVHRGKELSRLVVQRVCDPLRLVFQRLVQSLPGAGALARAAMAHLERRQAVGKEFVGGPDHRLRNGAARMGGKHALQGAVVGGSDVEHPQAIGQAVPSQLVCFATLRLAGVIEVLAQACPVLRGELLSVHGRRAAEAQRATSTSELSVVLA